MNQVFLYLIAALTAYLVGGINPAIVMSKIIYKQDIRTLGSKNPGFTNFKRVFGSKYAWFVFFLDLFKAAALCLIFCPIFRRVTGSYQLGAAYVGLFATLGHAYPVWYDFKGGKGFLVGACTIWFIDWRAGLIALIIMAILLFTTKYMSLSVIIAAISCPISLLIFGTKPIAVFLLCLTSSLFMIWRHKENIKRLISGTESKFSLLDKSKK